ncbi:MAG: RsmD family RNA methyltransferase [Candidatus Krumholzibacteriia bacterium]
MRVSGGRWRGRRLRMDRRLVVRPTADRVKEALFSILALDVPGVLVVDLCCGAGGLGIEALSRGAVRAVFVDRDRRSLELTAANLAACGADPATYRLVRSDARRWLAAAGRDVAGEDVLVVADPPYGTGLAAELAAGIGDLALRVPLRAAALEHAAEEMLPSVGPLVPDRRRYGRTALTILRPDESEPAGAGEPGAEPPPGS